MGAHTCILKMLKTSHVRAFKKKEQNGSKFRRVCWNSALHPWPRPSFAVLNSVYERSVSLFRISSLPWTISYSSKWLRERERLACTAQTVVQNLLLPFSKPFLTFSLFSLTPFPWIAVPKLFPLVPRILHIWKRKTTNALPRPFEENCAEYDDERRLLHSFQHLMCVTLFFPPMLAFDRKGRLLGVPLLPFRKI